MKEQMKEALKILQIVIDRLEYGDITRDQTVNGIEDAMRELEI